MKYEDDEFYALEKKLIGDAPTCASLRGYIRSIHRNHKPLTAADNVQIRLIRERMIANECSFVSDETKIAYKDPMLEPTDKEKEFLSGIDGLEFYR